MGCHLDDKILKFSRPKKSCWSLNIQFYIRPKQQKIILPNTSEASIVQRRNSSVMPIRPDRLLRQTSLIQEVTPPASLVLYIWDNLDDFLTTVVQKNHWKIIIACNLIPFIKRQIVASLLGQQRCSCRTNAVAHTKPYQDLFNGFRLRHSPLKSHLGASLVEAPLRLLYPIFPSVSRFSSRTIKHTFIVILYL